MARRTSTDLPLHSGSAPRWLFDRMVDLGNVIAAAVVEEHGPDELLRRLSDPYWFQALGCVLGFDWHSSGVTTTTMGALKEALTPTNHGAVVVGGKGATSRETPDEIDRTPLAAGRRETLKRTSRLTAAVDDGCVQDAYSLYHHTMVLSESGRWCVVQQGMNDDTARRYQWLSEDVDSFVETPQSAIAGRSTSSDPLDMTAPVSAAARSLSVDLVQDDPGHLERELAGQRSLADFGGGRPEGGATGLDVDSFPHTLDDTPELRMPSHHELRDADLSQRALDQLERAYEYSPDDYEELVDVDGIGPASLRALALIAELVYDTDVSRDDPAKYAFAHGGKDGTPHPVDRERYDRSIQYMRSTLEGAELERDTRQTALKRLADLE